MDRLLAKNRHPLNPLIEAIRRSVLDASPRITEGVKWNSPSFYCKGWFATVNARDRDTVLVVLHLGAKVRDDSTAGVSIRDPGRLLEWAAKERALARFSSIADFEAKKSGFSEIVRQWITLLD